MAKFDHFNLIGPVYDWVFGRRTNATLFDMVNLASDHTLLDIGGGTGRITMHFIEITPVAIVADSAARMLQEAQKKGLITVNTHSERLPFSSECFDRVIMVDAFHHVADQQQTMDEIWRTLAPGGRLIIEEPDIHHLLVKLIALGEKVLLMRSKFLKPQDILAMARYDDASNKQLYSENGIAWVIIEKKLN